MLDLVDGPLDLVDASALRTFPPAPSFLALAADHASQLAGVDQASSVVTSAVAAPPPVDVDLVYGSGVQPAISSLSYELHAAPASPVAALVASGDQAGQIRASVLPYLPQPSIPIETPFVSPPAPPNNPNPEQSPPAPTESQTPAG